MQEFKLIVAGGRDFNDYSLAHQTIMALANNEYKNVAVSIVSGMARGADSQGTRFALENGVVLYQFPADWNQYGKRAGFIRNNQMGDFADGLLAFWDGESRGTKQMIEYMRSLDKPVRVIHY
jgi:hypothetical protein